MSRRRVVIIAVVVLVLLCALIYAIAGSPDGEEAPAQLPEATNTTAAKTIYPTNTTVPEPTTWVGVIYCPECEGIALSLWQKIDDIGNPDGQVNHGDTCVVIERGVTDGIEKYKLNCNGKYGWLRAEGVKPK